MNDCIKYEYSLLGYQASSLACLNAKSHVEVCVHALDKIGGESKCRAKITSLESCDTSTGVETFFSLILSYFCFLVPAFNPCQGRLTKKSKIKI